MKSNQFARISVKLDHKRNDQSNRMEIPPRIKEEGDAQPMIEVETQLSAADRMAQLRRQETPQLEQSMQSSTAEEQPSIIGEHPPMPEDHHFFTKHVSFRKVPGMKLLLSAFGGIGVGLIFGLLVLAVFTQEQLTKSYQNVLGGTLSITAADTTQPQSGQGESASIDGVENRPSETKTEPLALSIQAERFFMAQVGAFSDPQSAEAAVGMISKKGFPHLLYREGNKTFLYAATASTRDDVLGMASFFKSQGMDVYVKEVILPGVEKRFLQESSIEGEKEQPDAKRYQAFFTDGVKLARYLTDWSGKFLSNPQAAKLEPSEEATIKELHRRFLDENRTLAAISPKAWQPQLTGMRNGLNQAVSALAQAKAAIAAGKIQNAESHTWQVQVGALTFLENYAGWLGEESSR